jgi:putative ABC transport system permease protein
VILKASGRPEALAALLRQAVREIDPDIPVASIEPMTAIVANSIEQPRFLALLVGVFAAAALALAAVGIYGLIAFSVAQRTQEIGVRMALGAGRSDVLRLIVFDGMKLTAVGLAIGAAGAAAAAASLQSQLFGVAPFDPITFGATAAALASTAIVACFVPAARAARVDPMVALRG